jgi:chromosome segregation ATPase
MLIIALAQTTIPSVTLDSGTILIGLLLAAAGFMTALFRYAKAMIERRTSSMKLDLEKQAKAAIDEAEQRRINAKAQADREMEELRAQIKREEGSQELMKQTQELLKQHTDALMKMVDNHQTMVGAINGNSAAISMQAQSIGDLAERFEKLSGDIEDTLKQLVQYAGDGRETRKFSEETLLEVKKVVIELRTMISRIPLPVVAVVPEATP